MKLGSGVLILLAVVFLGSAVAAGGYWTATAWGLTSWTQEGVEQQARTALGEGRTPSRAQLALAEQLTRAELRFGPQNPTVWCRLAYVQARRAGGMDEASAESLRRAYGFAAYSPDVHLWRTQFVFDNWTTAPPDLKAAALREVRLFYSMWIYRPQIELMAARVADPSGRLALELVLMKAPAPLS